jgi:hypothetical protein
MTVPPRDHTSLIPAKRGSVSIAMCPPNEQLHTITSEILIAWSKFNRSVSKARQRVAAVRIADVLCVRALEGRMRSSDGSLLVRIVVVAKHASTRRITVNQQYRNLAGHPIPQPPVHGVGYRYCDTRKVHWSRSPTLTFRCQQNCFQR